jgi:hypothetical protein
MTPEQIILALVYFVCFPMALAVWEFARRAGVSRRFCLFVQATLTVLAALSAAGLHTIGKF